MKKNLVVYYSNNGSNRFLAHQIATRLNSEIEEIRPVLNAHLLMLMGVGLGNRRLKKNVKDYDRIILTGPIWVGKFIYPLRKFVKKYGKDISELVFVTCCGSSYEMKNEKFGHGLVFNKLKEMLPGKKVECTALPITLVVPDDKKEDGKTVMETRLNDENFKGEIAERFEEFMVSLS